MSAPIRHPALFLRPSSALAPHVVGYIVRRRGSDEGEVGPAGEVVDFPANLYSTLSIVHRGAVREAITGERIADLSFSGVMTKPTRRELVDDPEITTVVFKPGAAARVTGLAGHELTDGWIGAGEVLAPTPYRDFVDQLHEQASVARQIIVVEQMLRQRLDQQPEAARPDTLGQLLEHGLEGLGRLRVTELARRVGLSERQLNRRVNLALGVGPKLFQRLARVHEAIRLARGQRDPHRRGMLAELAREVGFADLSHMAKELQLFTGGLPMPWRRRLHHPSLDNWTSDWPRAWEWFADLQGMWQGSPGAAA